MMKGGKGNQHLTTRAAGLRVATTVQGQAVPLLYGRYRINPKLIWASDFTATKQKTSKKSGGKKGGGDSYTYSAAGCWLLGHYPIRGVTQIWNNKDWYDAPTATVDFVVQSDGGGGGVVDLSSWGGWNPGDMIHVLGVNLRENFSMAQNDFGGDGPITVSGSWLRPMWNTFYYTPDGASGNSRGPVCYWWWAGWHIGFPGSLVGQTVQITWAYQAAAKKPLALLNLEFERHLCEGSEFTLHENQRIPYTWVSGLGSTRFDLGASDMFPAFTVEAIGAHDIWPDGGCDPSDIIQGLLNGTTKLANLPYPYAHAGETVPITHGVNNGQGLPITVTGLDWMLNWTRANGISCSLYLDSQRAAKDVLEELFDVGNCAPVWSGSILKCIPWDEVSAADHGGLYTAATAVGPICDLDDSAFICNGDTPPVTVDRTRQAEAANVLKLQHVLDRWEGLAEGNPRGDFNDYVTVEIEQRSVHQFGPRPADSREMRSITKKAIAQKIASVLVKRQAFQRNVYKFSLPVTYSFLEAMDLVTITEPWLGLNKQPVRLLSVKESFDPERGWELACEAERFIYGLNHPSPMELTTISPYTVVSNTAPGNVNMPIFFEPPDSLFEGNTNKSELWIGLSGASAEWGGCIVWLSSDGVTYEDVGTFISKSTMGNIGFLLPANPDPDNTNYIGVDLTESAGELSSFTAAEKDALRSLCLVGSELISYQNAYLMAANRYNLTGLRRGCYLTTISDHPAGTNFLKLGDDVFFRLQLDPTWIDKVAFLKFTSFNTRGGGTQQLADVPEYQYRFQGRYNNFLQVVANDSYASFVGPFTGGVCTVFTYGRNNGTPEEWRNITYFRSDGTSFQNYAMDLHNVPLDTDVYLMMVPVPTTVVDSGWGNYYLTDYAEVIEHLKYGAVLVNHVRTPKADGTGGQSGETGGGGFGGGSGSSCFTGNIGVQTPAGFVKFADLPEAEPFEIVNRTGTHQARLIVHRDYQGEMMDLCTARIMTRRGMIALATGKLVTVDHPMGCTPDPVIPAAEKYAGNLRCPFTGTVYNLEVLSENEEDKHYIIENGDVAHNKIMSCPAVEMFAGCVARRSALSEAEGAAGPGVVARGSRPALSLSKGPAGPVGELIEDSDGPHDDLRFDQVFAGTVLDCIDPVDGTPYRHHVEAQKFALSDCVRLTAASGAVLECSVTTPFTLPGHGQPDASVWAPDMAGRQVWVDDGPSTTPYLSIIVSVEEIGPKRVSHVSLGGRTFAAGRDPSSRIYSHNMSKAPRYPE